MQRTNNISFTSNIHFVDKAFFDSIKKGSNIDHLSELRHIAKGKNFYTMDVRTCSAGGLVVPYKEAAGFHFFPNSTSELRTRSLAIQLFDEFLERPTNGLLVGSKQLPLYEDHPFRELSVPFFQKLKKLFSERVTNVSVFEEHRKLKTQTHLYYSKEKDSWYLCAETVNSFVNSLGNKETTRKSVSNINALIAFYKDISIAPTDTLFINGREMKRKKYPFLFERPLPNKSKKKPSI